MNDVFGQVSDPAKDSLTDQNQPADGPASKRRGTEGQAGPEQALLGKAAVGWCAWLSEEGRFAVLGNSAAWLELQPEALLHAAGAAIVKQRPAVLEAVARWVDGVHAPVLFAALAVSNTRKDDLHTVLLEKTKDRFIKLEQHNEALEGGKHREERNTMIREFEAKEADLRRQLVEEQQRCQGLVAKEKEKMEEFRARLHSLVQA